MSNCAGTILAGLMMLAPGAAPAEREMNLEPIDYQGLQVVDGRDAPPKGAKQYQADHRHAPVIRVKPGEKFVIVTEDNTDGQLLVDGRYKKPQQPISRFCSTTRHTPILQAGPSTSKDAPARTS